MGATNCTYVDTSKGNAPVYVFDVLNGRDVLAHYKDGSETFALCPDGFIRTTTGWKNRQLSIGVGDIAANNDAYTYPLLRCKHDVTIIAASIACDTAVVANATNYQTIYLEQSGNSTDLSTLTTASTGFTAHVPRDFTIATTGDPDHLNAGDTLQLRMAKAASGVAMYGVTVTVVYTIDQPNTTIGTATDNVIRIANDIGTSCVVGANTVSRDFLSLRNNGTVKLRIDNNGKMLGTTADQYYYHTVHTGQLVTGDSGVKIVPLFSPHCTVQIEAVYFGAITTYAIDSNTNFWQIKIVESSGTKNITDGWVFGPYDAATAFTKGYLYDMGDINEYYGEISSSEKISAQFTESGTGPNIDGLTFTICFRKLD